MLERVHVNPLPVHTKSAIEVVRELAALHGDGLIELSDPLPVHTSTIIALK